MDTPNTESNTTPNTRERLRWYMVLVGLVGAVGLLTGIGTLTDSFAPLFGVWALAFGASLLIDTLAIATTVWAVENVRRGIPAGLVRLSAHVLIGVSVVAQFVTSYQGLGESSGGWTSAAAHTIAPLTLGLALELIYRHFSALWRKRTAPVLAAETIRVQVARASTGSRVQIRKLRRAVQEVARADEVNMHALTAQLSGADLTRTPALAVLFRIVDPEGARELEERPAPVAVAAIEAAPTPTPTPPPPPPPSEPASSAPALRPVTRRALSEAPARLVTVRPPITSVLTREERQAEAAKLSAQGLSVRAIAAELRVSPSTISTDLRGGN